jgi:hypothetical protein
VTALAAYAAFALLAILAPGVALQRLARVRLEPALVLPLGLSACAASYWLSLWSGAAWLFPALLATLDLALLLPLGPWRRVAGPSLAGALPPFLALLAFFAVTEYPLNRRDARGAFVFDNVVPEDTVFHVGLVWELLVTTPPEVPGLSGVPMGYHLGLPLTRAAALRWAGTEPFDVISRFEISLVGFAFIVGLRAAARLVGAPPAAVALAGWTALFTDFSFLFAGSPYPEAWLYLTDANVLFSLAHANSVVAALVMAIGLLVALERHRQGEGRGLLVLAMLLAAALPHFKAFVAAHALFGLGLAALLTRRWREPLLLIVPGLVGLAVVVLGRASQEMEIVLDPLAVGARLADALGVRGSGAGHRLLWGALWTLASLGLRLLGLPRAFRALRDPAPAVAAFAGLALSGWPIGLLFRVRPLDYRGFRPPYNEAWYFIEQSAPLLWVFTAAAAGAWALPRGQRIVAAALGAALCLPSSVQFVLSKRRVPAIAVPPAIVRAMDLLKAVSHPGDVVLMRPEPKRFPPPPMVLAGRRVPFTRYIPYLYQVAPRGALLERLELVRRFFKTTDAAEARSVAATLGARYVCLMGDDAVAFPEAGALRPLVEEPNVRLYEIVGRE